MSWDSLFWVPRRGLYQICPLWGVPELRENHFGTSRSTKPAKKLRSQQHRMTCLASLRHQTSKKFAPSSFTLLLGPPPAPFLIPKWCQNDVRELQIQPELLSGSHFPQLLLTIHWFTCHMEFGRALHSLALNNTYHLLPVLVFGITFILYISVDPFPLKFLM